MDVQNFFKFNFFDPLAMSIDCPPARPYAPDTFDISLQTTESYF